MATKYENSTQKTGSVAGKDCPCSTEEMQKIKKQYQEIVNRGRQVGANWAAQMLQHWMNGSGSDMIVKVDVLRRFDKIVDAEDALRNAMAQARKKETRMIVETIKDGEERVYYIYKDIPLSSFLWSELFYASGNSTLTGRLLLKAKRKGNTITMQGALEYHWWDPYDWHKGLSAYIPTVGTIDDDDADKYENAGCAKRFDMYSFWYQSFKETYIVDDILWFYDTDSIEWGEIQEGRPPVSKRGSWFDWWVNNHKAIEYDFTGESLPGLGKGKKGDRDAKHAEPKERRDREEHSREDSRRDDRRGRRRR